MTDLRTLRLRRYMTQRELADAVGVPYQTVQRWESGQSRPRPGNLRRLAEALAVTPEELLAPPRFQDDPVTYTPAKNPPKSFEDLLGPPEITDDPTIDVDDFLVMLRRWREEGASRDWWEDTDEDQGA